MEKREQLQAFMEEHVIRTHYPIVVWKACWRRHLLRRRGLGLPLTHEGFECKTAGCKPPRMDPNAFFDKIYPIPQPIVDPDNPGHLSHEEENLYARK